MRQITQILIKGIPQLYSSGFTDTSYVDARLELLPDYFSKRLETKEYWRTVHQPFLSDKQPVQIHNYRKYRLTTYANEQVNYNNLNLATDVTVIDENGSSVPVKVLSLKNDKLSDTAFYKTTIEFAEYIHDAVNIINYLTYPQNKFGKTDNDLVKLQLSNNKNIDNIIDFAAGQTLSFYTCLLPKLDRTKPELINNNQTGINYTFKSIDAAVLSIKLFLTENEMLQLKKYLHRCFYLNSGVSNGVSIIYNGNVYTAIEPVTADIKEQADLINVFEVDIDLKYDQTIFYPFAS